VIIQWANLIVSKTRYNSIVTQAMSNWWLNFGLVFETALTVLLVYCPYMDEALRLYPLRFGWWWPAVPFAVYFFVYDELRKFIMRKYPDSWLTNEWHFWRQKNIFANYPSFSFASFGCVSVSSLYRVQVWNISSHRYSHYSLSSLYMCILRIGQSIWHSIDIVFLISI